MSTIRHPLCEQSGKLEVWNTFITEHEKLASLQQEKVTLFRSMSFSFRGTCFSSHSHTCLILHPSTPRSPQWSLSLRFPHQDPIRPPLTHTRPTNITYRSLCLHEFCLDWRSFSTWRETHCTCFCKLRSTCFMFLWTCEQFTNPCCCKWLLSYYRIFR